MRDLRGILRKEVLQCLFTTTVASALPVRQLSGALMLAPKTGANLTAVEQLLTCDCNFQNLN
jgi:hypothetical protein